MQVTKTTDNLGFMDNSAKQAPSAAYSPPPFPGKETANYPSQIDGTNIPALSLVNLTKRFEDHVAVNNLSLDIPSGSFYGIVGPNGAGKSTAISMATGLLRPDNGTAYVCGHNIWSTQQFAAKAQFGLLADGLPVFDRLTGREYLNYLGAIREIPSETVRKRSDELLDVLELRDAENKFIVDYSAGMTKKILLAGALLHRPRLLVLDEPLEAVDPVSAQIIRQILTHFVRGGGTVVISSHVMELVEGICDHVAIIANGEVLRAGSLEDVRQGRKLTDVFVELVGGGTLDDSSLSWLSESEDPNA